ncbi:aldo/keto reductase [Xylanibacter ruminicola]|uniref:aldo/keto reductase n=2 Tax=Xylanibacter ruminicola TaxID=839 RepID=UPI002936D7DD|nr:aldo/keto reductase [Xylanibacter ruminicola]
MMEEKRNMSRRDFLRRIGMGAGVAMASSVMGPLRAFAQDEKKGTSNRMTYRVQHGSGEQISLLGFGMMRLPNNQEEVNQLVDYAIEHGVNYFDTAPMYMGGQSEVLTGNALSRHPREKYYIATKMSNQNQRLWSFEESQKMYYQSFKRLKVDHIDYYLMHSIGVAAWIRLISALSTIIC